MKKPTIKLRIIAMVLPAFLTTAIFSGCDQSRKNATLNNTQDTTSINKAGGPAIADTATVAAHEKSAKRDSAKGDTMSNGNVDPKGTTKH